MRILWILNRGIIKQCSGYTFCGGRERKCLSTLMPNVQQDQVEELKTACCTAIQQAAGDLHALSRDLWDHPELAFEEHYAHENLTAVLHKYGFTVTPNYTLPTAFRADFITQERDEGVHALVISEYDALPDIGHACGHNLIAEVGVATGIGIKAALTIALQKYNMSLGKVTVLGTPAEEGKGGKIDMIKQQVFDEFDFALMAHPFKITMARPLKFAMEEMRITFHGRPSHAAGFPWEGINALDAAVCCYNNLSCLRQQMKPNWRLHGVITNGGATPGIIPEEASLHYYVRAPTLVELNTLKQKVTACVNAAAMATGCTVDINKDNEPKPYANMVTNNTLASLYEQNAPRAEVDLCTDEAQIKSPTGSTDFGNVSHLLPAIHPMYYIGTSVANHTREFAAASATDEAQSYTIRQSQCLAMTAVDILCNKTLQQQMKRDFKADLQSYTND